MAAKAGAMATRDSLIRLVVMGHTVWLLHAHMIAMLCCSPISPRRKPISFATGYDVSRFVGPSNVTDPVLAETRRTWNPAMLISWSCFHFFCTGCPILWRSGQER